MTKEKKIEIIRLCDDFRSMTRRLFKIIRPFGFFSVLKQKILILLRREAFTPPQTEALAQLNRKVAEFLGTFQREPGPRDQEQAPLRLT
jgi:hypothetical protein